MSIEDFSFQPATVTVSVGDSVTWTNADEAPHSATADDGSFDTGTFGKGESRSHQFTEAGTFSYFCEPHPSMKATVRVMAAGSDAPSSDPDPGGSGDSGSDEAGSTESSGSTGGGQGSEGGSSLPLTGAALGSLAAVALALILMGSAARIRPKK